MGVWTRMFIATGVTISAGAMTLVWARVGLRLIDRLNQQSGPFSSVGGQISSLFPLVMSALVLGVWVWVIAAGVQKQLTDRRRVQR